MKEQLVDAIANVQEDEALRLTQAILDSREDPKVALEACREAMAIVGRRYEEGEYFLPHLIMAGVMLKQISETIKPLLKEEKAEAGRARVLMGTVKGDIHDIGKNIVSFLLEVNGF